MTWFLGESYSSRSRASNYATKSCRACTQHPVAAHSTSDINPALQPYALDVPESRSGITAFAACRKTPIGIVKICTLAPSNYPVNVTTVLKRHQLFCAQPIAQPLPSRAWRRIIQYDFSEASVFSLDCNAVNVKPSGASNALSPSREPEKYLSQFLTTAALSTWLSARQPVC
jgi:hypothetical protein